MNPPLREQGTSRKKWGRWDVADGRTIYAADPAECAYAETLAWARKAIDIDLLTLFDPSEGESDEDLKDLTLETEAESEWGTRHHMPVGSVPAGWRQERLIHDIQLPESGWFVDIDAAETISAIIKHWPGVLSSAGVRELTSSQLHGENRDFTTTLAEKIRALTLYDGALPHGITYASKHDSEWLCWAVWLRALDDGKPLASEPTQASSGRVIEAPINNMPLRRVCGIFDIACH